MTLYVLCGITYILTALNIVDPLYHCCILLCLPIVCRYKINTLLQLEILTYLSHCSNCSVQLSLNVRHSLSTFRFLPDMVKIQNETKLQLSSSDDGRQKLKKNIYASYSTLGGATYFNYVRSSNKDHSRVRSAIGSIVGWNEHSKERNVIVHVYLTFY